MISNLRKLTDLCGERIQFPHIIAMTVWYVGARFAFSLDNASFSIMAMTIAVGGGTELIKLFAEQTAAHLKKKEEFPYWRIAMWMFMSHAFLLICNSTPA